MKYVRPRIGDCFKRVALARSVPSPTETVPLILSKSIHDVLEPKRKNSTELFNSQPSCDEDYFWRQVRNEDPDVRVQVSTVPLDFSGPPDASV